MHYKLLHLTPDGVQIIGRIDDDGLCRVTCTDQNPEYLKWLEEDGNQPLPADEPQQ